MTRQAHPGNAIPQPELRSPPSKRATVFEDVDKNVNRAGGLQELERRGSGMGGVPTMASLSDRIAALRRPTLSICILPALCLLLVGIGGCGDDEPTGPDGNDEKGFIAGTAFLLDDTRITQVKIEIFDAETDEKVSTTFPDDDGTFQSDPLDQGIYDLAASVELPGYFVGRVDNINVLAGQTTSVEVTVPDTSRVRFENLAPPLNSLHVERKPRIAGEFRCAGAGYRIGSFILEINGERIDDVDVYDIEPLRHGAFEYTPPVNLLPGQVTVHISMFNQANYQSESTWRFRILEGISRRVPSEYGTIQEAVFACNDGDTVLVAPGTYVVDNINLGVDVVVLGEGGQDVTTLTTSGNRHFRVFTAERRVTIKGLTLSGGRSNTEPGGSILCDEADMVVEDCTFENNQSSNDRGGAIALYDTNAKIRRCLFVANRAYRGGAIAMFDQSSPEIAHCVFIRNQATAGIAGAIEVRSADASIHNSTFYRNSATSGSCIYLDFDLGPANVFSESNIFAENVAGPTGSTIYFNQSNLSSNCDGFHRNVGGLIDGSGAASEVTYLLDLASDTDPLFCDAAAENLRLDPESPFLAAPCEERGAFPPGCTP